MNHDEVAARLLAAELNRVNPVLVLGRGYFIPSPSFAPGTICYWRPLGDKRGRLANLAAREAEIRRRES